jgi:hypothetical protein
MDLENDFEQQQGYQGEIIILGENQAATQALIDKNNEEDFNSKEEGLNRKIVYNESIYDGKNSVSEVDNNIVVEEGIRPSKPVNSASVVLGRKANGLTKPSIPVFIWEKG